MANTKTLRLSVGALFTKGPGKIYFYRYQVAGRRKTVSLHTNNRAEALKKARELIPIVKGLLLRTVKLGVYIVYIPSLPSIRSDR